MEGMNDSGNMNGMGGGGMAPPPTNDGAGGATMAMQGTHMMMHMTFFWGKEAEILFDGWPGRRSGMYALALVFVFALALIVEWLSHCNLIRDGSNHITAGIVRTLLYGLRIGLAYMVMLAVMSFNAGVFLVAVAGHVLGFLFFGSRVFNRASPPQPTLGGKTSDLPPMTC